MGKIVITVDGPAASGKSSLSSRLSQELGGKWVSTGAFYRGLGYVAQKEKVNFSDEKALAELCTSSLWQVELAPIKTKVFYNSIDVTDEIYTVEVGTIASQVSQFPKVRTNLLQAQRDCAQLTNLLIAEGRDCGSVVFPGAFLKIYLTANENDRAARRAKESGRDVDEQSKLIRLRDNQDSQRKSAPLKKVDDAIEIDSSMLSMDQVFESALEVFKEKYRSAYKSEFALSR
jgi:cytidylate kinase